MSDVNDFTFIVSKPLLTAGIVPSASLEVVKQDSYTTNIIATIRQLLSDVSSITPLPNENCAYTTITWESTWDWAVKLRDAFAQANYGCNNQVALWADTLTSKINGTASIEKVRYTRYDSNLFLDAFKWLVEQTGEVEDARSTFNMIGKNSISSIQTTPDVERVHQKLKIMDNIEEVSTSLGITDGLGLDTTFATDFELLIDTSEEKDVVDQLEMAVTDAPTVSGVVADNLAPVVFNENGFLSGVTFSQAGESKISEDYAQQMEEELEDLIGPSRMDTPIKEQKDLMSVMLTSDIEEEVTAAIIKPAINATADLTLVNRWILTYTSEANATAGTSPIPVEAALVINNDTTNGATLEIGKVVKSVSLREILEDDTVELDLTKKLPELDWALVPIEASESLQALKWDGELYKRIVRTVDIKHPLHATVEFGINPNHFYVGVLNHKVRYTPLQAFNLGQKLSGLWKGLKKTVLSDPVGVISTMAMGGSALSKIAGAAGFVNLSTCLGTVSSGLGDIQKIATTIFTTKPELGTKQDIFTTTLQNATNSLIPSTLKKGHDEFKKVDKGSTQLMNYVDQSSKVTDKVLGNVAIGLTSISANKLGKRMSTKRGNRR